MGETERVRASGGERPMGTAIRRERVQGKEKGKWREANRNPRLQRVRVMPTPPTLPLGLPVLLVPEPPL